MDPQTNLPDLIEDLEVDIDELTTALEPLLSKPLHTTASSLPLLDKAKLYCLAAYAIESLLFASLTASGVNATEHAIFKEIARLRQYNSKIKEIEDRGIKGSAEGRARLDVAAAGRFIKHGLAGNDKYDLERQERMAKERARAHLKAQQINKKFDDEGKEASSKGQAVTPKKRGAEDDEDVQDDEEQVDETSDSPATKKPRVEGDEVADTPQQQQPKKRGRPSKKDKPEATSTPTMRGSRRNKSRLSNQNTNTEDNNDNDNEEEGIDGEAQEDTDSAPKTRSETFTALLDGSHKQKKARGKSGKKGGKGRGK